MQAEHHEAVGTCYSSLLTAYIFSMALERMCSSESEEGGKIESLRQKYEKESLKRASRKAN
jgi:hypothetical protein